MKFTECIQIIKDDFNNVLVLKKKAKKGAISQWTLLKQKIKGRERDEKCLERAAKDILKTIVFDNTNYKEFEINKEESVKVYIGKLRQKYILDKSYDEAMWINKDKLDDFYMEDLDKKILLDYYN